MRLFNLIKYHMRRVEKEITEEKELIGILKNEKYATIAMCKENEAYLVTLSYGYDETKNALYFHCAKEGQKMDFIKSNPIVCGTVVEDNGYEDGCGQTFRSVVFRGKMIILEEIQEKICGFDVLLNQLENDPLLIKNKFFKEDEAYDNLGMIRLDVMSISGKEEKADS